MSSCRHKVCPFPVYILINVGLMKNPLSVTAMTFDEFFNTPLLCSNPALDGADILRLFDKSVSISIEMLKRLARQLPMKPVLPAQAGIQRQ
jgi:hypothetical protein